MKRSFLKSRWILYVVFVLASALLILILYPSSKEIRVKEVEDGDTVILNNGERVRYIGIDTPEKGEPYFREATEANREMLEGEKITLEYDVERRDDWGRILAYVWVGNILINAELIEKGWALAYTHPPNLKYRNTFCSLQTQARKARVGIWSLPVSEKEKYYLGNKRSFRFHRPDCKSALQMAERNKIVFKTREEALDSCYSPCRNCKP